MEKEIIIDDPLEWYKVPIEDRAKELIKYHQENKIKVYSHQTSLI